MLYHDVGGDYNVAASNAARKAREKMDDIISRGMASAGATVQKVIDEVPEDRIVKATALRFDPMEEIDGVNVTIGNQDTFSIGKHALGQFCSRAHVPMAFYKYLTENEETSGWGSGLVANVLNEMYDHMGDHKRFLARSFGGTLRGWLSDSYRRLDSRPLLDSFLGAINDLNAVPVEGYASETKVMVKAMLPAVFEPVDNEVLCYGVSWENSDYGNGAHSIRVFVLRLWCTNYAIANEGIRQIHLGKRLSEEIRFSQETYDADTKATALAIGDIVRGSLSAPRVDAMNQAISHAANEEIAKPGDYLTRKLKNVLTKGERQEITDTYNTPDVMLLPPGNTTWRMSNAISLFAQRCEDTERKIELMKVAGSLVPALAEQRN
jgi:hypothetical protein